jgi:hypothetical protein
MATRYWVGGSGNWDATSTTNWSATSGGASGASAPTAVDDVIFDANSNTGTTAFTVTVTGTAGAPALCRDFSTGGAGGALDAVMTFTVALASSQINIFGSLTLPASNFVWSTGLATIKMAATSTGKTITTNGITLQGGLTFDGVGGEWKLGSAYTTSSNIVVTNGSFVTNNYNFTSSAATGSIIIISANSNTKAVTLGSSTLTIASTTPLANSSTGGLTWNAGTSTIICSNSAPTFAGSGLTFYNVSFTSTAAGTVAITGVNTFNNLTFTSLAATGYRNLNFGANQTINGTLTLGATNTSIRRMVVYSSVFGTQRTLTVATIATLNDVDFESIVAAGASGTWSGTRLGNAGNNSNITFVAGKTVYWNLAAGGNWSSTAWALTSGGAVDANNFPLPQDTTIIENTGLNTSASITLDLGWYIGSINASSRSNAMTFATSSRNPAFLGNIILSSSVTTSGTGVLSFLGYGITQTITTAAVAFTQGITVNSIGGTVTFADNLTSAGTVTLTSGTLNLNDKTLTCTIFSSNNSNTRAIAFGTGVINLTGNNNTIWSMATATGFTYTGTSTVNCTYSGSTGTRTIGISTSGGTESNAINFNISAGSDIVTFSNGNIRNLNFTGFTGILGLALTIYGNLTLNSSITMGTGVGPTFSATSGIKTITTGGLLLNRPFNFNGIGGTWQLQDNMTFDSTIAVSLTAGTLDVNSKTLTTGGFSSSNSNVRTIAMGTNGKIRINSTNWNAGLSTNLSLTGTGTIDMISGTAMNFNGGSKVYPYTLNQGGAGALTITGSNYFNKLSNTNTTASTIIFPASTTTYIKDMKISGNAGNLVSFRSSIDGTRYTLSTF